MDNFALRGIFTTSSTSSTKRLIKIARAQATNLRSTDSKFVPWRHRSYCRVRTAPHRTTTTVNPSNCTRTYYCTPYAVVCAVRCFLCIPYESTGASKQASKRARLDPLCIWHLWRLPRARSVNSRFKAHGLRIEGLTILRIPVAWRGSDRYRFDSFEIAVWTVLNLEKKKRKKGSDWRREVLLDIPVDIFE